MANVFDYLEWRGDLDFAASPLNDVDAVILAGLSYLIYGPSIPADFNEYTSLAQACNKYAANGSNPFHVKESDIRLLEMAAANPRFGLLQVCGYQDELDEEQEKQFSAITFILPEGGFFISYRGTGDPIVGWKEDFNMSYMCPVPAQREALDYLRRAAASLEGPILLGGHSKGGNLAIFAAAHAEPDIQARIQRIFSFDGPGFQPEVLDSPGYQAVKSRICSFIPQASIVGLLLGSSNEHTVISSTESGLFQHSLYDWQVTRDGFVILENLSAQSRFADKTINSWIAGLDNKQREVFFDALFQAIGQADAETVSELGGRNWLSHSLSMIKGYLGLDEETKNQVGKTMQMLRKSAFGNLSLLRSRQDQDKD